jgi:hypothetical protein
MCGFQKRHELVRHIPAMLNNFCWRGSHDYIGIRHGLMSTVSSCLLARTCCSICLSRVALSFELHSVEIISALVIVVVSVSTELVEEGLKVG